jgi:EAL domain-containing protein (putative c-di-GMP-specific phosphodiesterase class I)
LIVPIGEWVLRTAWQQASEWRHDGRAIRMTVNISARQLAEDSISTLIRDVVGGGTHAHDLVIELTESLLVLDPPGAAERLRVIRSLEPLSRRSRDSQVKFDQEGQAARIAWTSRGIAASN